MSEVEQKPQPRYETEELNELFAALSKAQLEMETAKNDSKNPFFKSNYADLSSVVKASRPYLAKHGLCVVQRILPNGNGIQYLYTRIGHASGQWMESKMGITPPKADIQSVGSYITYLRRYSYASMVGVISSEEDDDGEKAMSRGNVIPHAAKPNQSGEKKEKPAALNKEQLSLLVKEINGDQGMSSEILNAYGISSLSLLPADKFDFTLKRIREIKRVKETVENKNEG